MRRALIGLLVFLAASCGGGDEPKGPLADLGEAACADLRAGLSFFQIAKAGLDSGLSEEQVASAILLGVEDHCPEFEEDFKKTLIYTEWCC